MKKITGLLLTAQITLYAGMTEVQTLYDQKNYESAIIEAEQSTKEFGNPKLHLLWAKSAEALGKDEMAMSAYERVLMMDPDNTEVRVHLASLYAYLDRDELATKMSKSTENYQLTPSQRMSLDTLKKADLETIKASASLSIGYDSNVNVSSNDLTIPNNEEALSSLFTQFRGNLSYTHELEEKGGWYLRSDADIFYQNNADASYYNLFAGSVDLGVGYRDDNYDLFLPVKYGRVNYLDRDFMETIGIEPRANIVFSKSLIGNMNARYTERSYLDIADKNRDDTVFGYGAGLYWLFDKNFAYLKGNYDDYDAKHLDHLRFTDKETLSINIGVNYDINDWFVTRLDYRYRYTLYRDFIDDGSKQREDDYGQYEFKFSKMVSDTMEGSLLYRYSNNRSNYDLAEYDKDVVMFGFQYNY